MEFRGNDKNPVHKKLGEKLEIVGGATGATSNKNTKVINNSGKLEIQFAETPEFKGINLVNGSNNVGLTPGVGNALNLSGGNNGAAVKITNVAPGFAPTDAVNVSQLNGIRDNVLMGFFKDNQDISKGNIPAHNLAFNFGDGLKASVEGKSGRKFVNLFLDKDALKNDPAFTRKDVTYGGSVGYQW